MIATESLTSDVVSMFNDCFTIQHIAEIDQAEYTNRGTAKLNEETSS